MSPGIEVSDGAREHGPLLAAYMHVKALSGMVVLQVGTRDFRRTMLLTAEDAKDMAQGMRECVPFAVEQRPQMLTNGFPNPHDLGNIEDVDEDVFFARINAWAQELTWIDPDADIGTGVGFGVAHAHVVHLRPMPGEPGRYTVTFFQPDDIAWLAGKLEGSADEAAEMTIAYDVASSIGPGAEAIVPSEDDILDRAQEEPWPPADAEDTSAVGTTL